MRTINPYDGELIKEYINYSDEKIASIVDDADEAFSDWKQTTFKDRAKYFLAMADLLEKKKGELASLMTTEMGKPISQGISEIEKCVWVCHYYAKNAEVFLAPEQIETDFKSSEVHHNPLGVILAIMPWNYPFWQVFRFAVPTLMAGNTGILKHSENVSECSLKIHELFETVNFPKGIFTSILAENEQVKKIIENKKIKAVTLTGSGRAGKSVASIAGANLKKTLLELGGSDAYIILEDANLEKAAKLCAESRLLNAGQSCIGAKRFIVVEKVYEEFKDLFIKEVEKSVMGDPKNPKVNIGPMARFDLRDDLHTQVTDSLEKGARLLFGGFIPDHVGAFYPPTILENVTEGMPAYHEELFGPVASLIKVASESEAIRVANSSDFGLGGAIFSEDINRARDIAINQIESGACFVNDYVKSDPRLPFGGVKESGYGRELSSFGIKEFTNIKTVCVSS